MNKHTTFEIQAKNQPHKDEWLTPPYIIEDLGPFDLDPCAPINRPWDIAKDHYTYLDNGLMLPWKGKVFYNPPYGPHTKYWLDKCILHGNVIALTFARVETKWFFNYVWQQAVALLFLKDRIKFYDNKGIQGDRAGWGSVLIAYNNEMAEKLRISKLKGQYIKL